MGSSMSRKLRQASAAVTRFFRTLLCAMKSNQTVVVLRLDGEFVSRALAGKDAVRDLGSHAGFSYVLYHLEVASRVLESKALDDGDKDVVNFARGVRHARLLAQALTRAQDTTTEQQADVIHDQFTKISRNITLVQ